MNTTPTITKIKFYGHQDTVPSTMLQNRCIDDDAMQVRDMEMPVTFMQGKIDRYADIQSVFSQKATATASKPG